MRPTDDEYRTVAIHALMALEGDLDRALNGPFASREATRDIGTLMRDLLARADKALGEDTEDLVAIVERAKAKVLEMFGTSGWGEDDPPRNLPPLPSSSGRRR